MAELNGITVTPSVPEPAVLSQPVDAAEWEALSEELAAGHAPLVDLWGDSDSARMAVTEPGRPGIRILSLPCPDKRFPSVGRKHAPAIRLERAVRDLYGLEPAGSPDGRPWLDHGRWPVRHPLGNRMASAAEGDSYTFLP